MKRTFVLVSAIAAAGIVATAGSARHAERGGALHVTKECSEYNGTVGSFCTITSSNIRAIEPGMKVVYLAASRQRRARQRHRPFVRGTASAALGHVVLDLGRAKGRVTFSGGTGRFAGFRAHAVVSVDSTGHVALGRGLHLQPIGR